MLDLICYIFNCQLLIVFYHHLFPFYFLFHHLSFYQIHEPCLILTIFSKMSGCLFNLLPNSKYSNLLILAVFLKILSLVKHLYPLKTYICQHFLMIKLESLTKSNFKIGFPKILMDYLAVKLCHSLKMKMVL